MASGLILGILFMRYQKWYLAAVAAGILFGIVWNLWHNTIRNCSEKDSMANARAWMYPAFRVGCFLAFFLAGIFHFAENEAFRQNYMSKLQDGMQVTVQGKLCSKQLKNGQYSYYLDHCYLSIGQEILPCNQILFYQTSDDDSIGQTLIVTGTVELWKSASNDGNFDAKAFYESKKIDFQLKEAIVKNVYGAEDEHIRCWCAFHDDARREKSSGRRGEADVSESRNFPCAGDFRTAYFCDWDGTL